MLCRLETRVLDAWGGRSTFAPCYRTASDGVTITRDLAFVAFAQVPEMSAIRVQTGTFARTEFFSVDPPNDHPSGLNGRAG